ncbi:MAG: nuclear transport factor 2 family protein [Solirubrobacterales bacterium]
MAPSSTNEDFVRDLVERWNAGDRESMLESLDPEAELHSRLADLVHGGSYEGQAGFRQWFSDIDEQFADFRISFDEIRDVDPSRVFCSGAIDFRGRSSDLPWEQEISVVFTVREGRLLTMDIYTAREEGRRAAGLEDG